MGKKHIFIMFQDTNMGVVFYIFSRICFHHQWQGGFSWEPSVGESNDWDKISMMKKRTNRGGP